VKNRIEIRDDRLARRRRCAAACALLTAALACAGCARPAAGPPPEPPRVEDMTVGPVRLSIKAEPPRVHYDRDLVLTISVSAPETLDVELPPLADRLGGFEIAGFYENESTVADGRKTRVYNARLTPLTADEHRLAPMALRVTDTRSRESAWLATRPIVFETAPSVAGPTPDGVRVDLQPVWVAPPARALALGALGALAVAALAALAVYGALRARRRVVESRMSPRERALRALDRLMGRGLPERGQVKEFYLELTMIVRRYIEWRHGVHAPEQTTEEFLAAVRDDARFAPEVVSRLTAFLEAADLVKYAAHRPAAPAVAAAGDTARGYIETDDRTQAAADARQGKGG
jgi:hypothetical protein